MEPYLVMVIASTLTLLSWFVQRSVVSRRQARDEFVLMRVQNASDHKRTTETLVGVTGAISKLSDEVVLVREDVAHIKGRMRS
tara:strand:- start:241 stop:489 length:249 start_codon:yes stop_codon:yes gene_type:complete